jgi:hypothetical protein
LASGLLTATKRPIQTRFRCGFPGCLHNLVNLATVNNSPDHSSTGTLLPIPLSCESSIGLELLVCIQFQVLFTLRQEYFSPFPRGTGSLSVERSYLALESGLPRFPPDFTCPMVLRSLSRKSVPFRLQGCHLLWRAFPSPSTRRPIFDFPTLRSDKSYNPNRVCTRFV